MSDNWKSVPLEPIDKMMGDAGVSSRAGDGVVGQESEVE